MSKKLTKVAKDRRNMSKTAQKIEVSPDCEKIANQGYYMISAALDIMESTFGDRELHEKITGKKNTMYVTAEQLDMIMYLLYESGTSAEKLRDALST
jgi:hypothetical protein